MLEDKRACEIRGNTIESMASGCSSKKECFFFDGRPRPSTRECLRVRESKKKMVEEEEGYNNEEEKKKSWKAVSPEGAETWAMGKRDTTHSVPPVFFNSVANISR